MATTYSTGYNPSTKTLGSNEIFASLANMILSMEVYTGNIKGSDLVDQAKVDGGVYGDTKLYFDTDALYTAEFDSEDANVLEQVLPEDPEVQAIVLNKFRFIQIAIDDYLSKRAWLSADSFNTFNSVMTGWLADTKKVYLGTTYNAYIGTTESDVQSDVTVTVGANDNEAEKIAQALADLVTDMTDYSRAFNDYGNLKRLAEDEIKIIFNAKYINKIKNIDLPEIFHNEGLNATFSRDVLNPRYFGDVNTAATKGDGSTVRALEEQFIGTNHYFAGDLIKTTDTAPAGKSYTQNDNIIAKVVTKLPPVMSGFEIATSFYNPKNLRTNHYVHFAHNELAYLKACPLVTVKKAA